MQHTGIPVINFLLFIFHFFPHIQICEKPGGVARLFRRRYFVSYGVQQKLYNVLGGFTIINITHSHKKVFTNFGKIKIKNCAFYQYKNIGYKNQIKTVCEAVGIGHNLHNGVWLCQYCILFTFNGAVQYKVLYQGFFS